MNRRIPILLMLLALMLLLAGCGQGQTGQAEAVTIVDAEGAEVALTVHPERVIVIDPSTCEIFYAIGAQDSLIAVGSYCDYPAEVAEKTKVGAYSDLNVEEIVALEPDLILFGTMSTDEAKVDALKSAGIEVAVLRADTIADTYANIAGMGLVMGKKAEADKVAEDMKRSLDDIAALGAAQEVKKTAYIEVGPLEEGSLVASGGGTFQDELITLVGAENIFGSEGRWATVSEEQVVQRNPDVIITSSMYEGYDPMAEIPARAGWEGVSAIVHGDIHYLENGVISHASPRLVQGAQQLYDAIYGE